MPRLFHLARLRARAKTDRMSYLDGFLLAVPKDKVAAYRKLATATGKLFREHGALEYIECVEDDVKPGKVTSFPQAVKKKPGEVVVFSYIVFKSRRDRDRISKAVMADPRMKKLMTKETMPFDGKRMMYGGFKSIVALA